MFCRSTIKFVLFLIFLNGANSLKCQKCSVNDYHTDCRAGTITEATECSPEEDSCYLEFLYGPDNNYIPEYSRGCTTKDFCREEEEERENDIQTCNTCQDDMCNNDPIEDDIGTFYSGPLECQKCSDTSFDSDCRFGKIEERSNCSKEDTVCYVDYRIVDDTPLYRRGCATKDWCEIQKNDHGKALKSCTTCSSRMCNKDVIGAPDTKHIECFTCDASKDGIKCLKGNDLEKVTCKSQGRGCYEYYFTLPFHDDENRRGCESTSFCDKMNSKHGYAVAHCTICDLDSCNDNLIKQAQHFIG